MRGIWERLDDSKLCYVQVIIDLYRLSELDLKFLKLLVDSSSFLLLGGRTCSPPGPQLFCIGSYL